MQVIRWYTIIFMLMFSFFLHTCIEPYNPELKQYKNQLVIYGLITNEEGPHEIKISRTIATYKSGENPEIGAIVAIIDQHDNLVSLSEAKAGIYSTPNDFKGKVNNMYKLLVTTKDGNFYESEFVKLLEVPEISELSSKFIEKEGPNLEMEYGYEFNVSINEINNSLKYYRWSFKETWEIVKPFTVSYYWTGSEMTDTYVPNSCWLGNEINKTVIASTDDFEVNTIQEHPLILIDNANERLTTKYCLHVKQYSLSEQSYYYWKAVMANNEEQGSLYDKQPYQLVGNMENVNNTHEKVLGIFEASAVAYKRILVRRIPRGIPIEEVDGFDDCSIPPYEGNPPKPGYLTSRGAFISKECVECKTVNGTLNKPEYWDEDIYTD